MDTTFWSKIFKGRKRPLGIPSGRQVDAIEVLIKEAGWGHRLDP
jgi:hypothetical protein